MRFDFVHKVDGASLLGCKPEAAECDTTFARVIMRREPDGQTFRLVVAPKGDDLPEAVSNPIEANVARHFKEIEDQLAVLADATIALVGSATELRCSVVINELALARINAEAIVYLAGVVLTPAIGEILGVKLPEVQPVIAT